MTETAIQVFEQFEDYVLDEYNTHLNTDKEPVDKYNEYFKAYLIGRMSAMIPTEQFTLQMKKGNK